MADEDAYAINFWPAFSDFLLAIVLVLVLAISMALSTGVDVGDLARKQQELAENKIFLRSGLTMQRSEDATIEWRQGIQTAIRFRIDANNPFLQLITFSDFVLFGSDDFILNGTGRNVLRIVGEGIRGRINVIEGIQIHGHADLMPTHRFADNLELAGLRAMAVYRYLQRDVGIDPVSHLMSATSYAEYVPVARRANAPFTWEELMAQNRSGTSMRRNRRVEILLFYRRQVN